MFEQSELQYYYKYIQMTQRKSSEPPESSSEAESTECLNR